MIMYKDIVDEDPSYISGLEADVRAKKQEEASSYQKLNDMLKKRNPTKL